MFYNVIECKRKCGHVSTCAFKHTLRFSLLLILFVYWIQGIEQSTFIYFSHMWAVLSVMSLAISSISTQPLMSGLIILSVSCSHLDVYQHGKDSTAQRALQLYIDYASIQQTLLFYILVAFKQTCITWWMCNWFCCFFLRSMFLVVLKVIFLCGLIWRWTFCKMIRVWSATTMAVK